MKTTLTFALAFTAQVIANAQISGNQAHLIRMELSPSINALALQADETAAPACPDEAVGKLLDEEQQLKAEIAATQKKLIQKQIAVSRIRSYMAYDLFAANSLMIEDLINNPSLKPAILEKSQALHNLASREIKLAREIREEADAQPLPEAQLAAMSNAEEKEALALAKQQEAIRLLRTATPLFIKQASPEFASKMMTETSSAQAEIIQATDELTQQANAMKQTCEQLRAAAIEKTGQEKAAMLNEALSMEQDYIAARIRISLRQYQQTEKSFLANKQFIALLIEGIGDESLTRKAQALCEEADHHFRLGKEIREEANAQPTEAARLAEMSNAEEKELLALGMQQQSVNALKKLNKGFLLAAN